MNMGGGGAMLKTVGRAIGVGGGRSPCSPNQSWKSASQSKHRPSASASASSSSSAATELHEVEEGETWVMTPGWGDWELMGNEVVTHNFGQHEFIDRVVFGTSPTKEEVEGAISDLQNAIPQSVDASQVTLPESQGSISISQGYETSVQKSNHSAGVAVPPESNTESCRNVVDWIEPVFHPAIHGVVQPLGRNNSLDAFKLLKNDTAVQGMVVSLASDKAIWDAVLKNDKVLEFRKSLQNGEPKLEDISKGSDNACDSNKPTLFTEAVENVKHKVTEYMEKITQLIHQIFGFANKTLSEKDGDILDRTIKSSLMLTVAVLLVVLVKRGQNF